jgi:hypothetical protein
MDNIGNEEGNGVGNGNSDEGGGRQRERWRWQWQLQLQQQLGWWAKKRAMGRATKRVMAMATKKAMVTDGDNMDNGYQHGQWLLQRGWRAFDGGNDGVGAKDMAARATTGERGMMVAMGHGLCVCFSVCGETTKNKKESKIVMVT